MNQPGMVYGLQTIFESVGADHTEMKPHKTDSSFTDA